MSSPEDPNLSKRERQKLRRDRKRQAEAAAASKARRNRMLALGGLAVLTAGLIGWFALGLVTRILEDRRLRAEAAGKLDELGCTEVQQLADLGGGHLDGAQLAGNPPGQLYPDRPTASGQHLGTVTRSGVYDTVIDERVTTHNLEHGYVVFWYDPDAPDDEVAELKEFARGRIGGTFPKLIVAEYFEPLPGGVNFSTVAWGVRQNCEEFDAGVALTFMDAHYGLAGQAPEKELAPHTGDDVPAPEEGQPLLFPPLDRSDGGSPEATEPEPRPTG